MFIDFINAYGPMLIQAILVAVLGGIGMAIKKVAARWLDTDTEQKIARMAVRFVEQTYRELHGPQKLQKALHVAAVALRKRKIIFEADEIRQMIEAAVEEMNAQASAGVTVEGVSIEELLADSTGQAPAEDTEE